jgi:hypothetical protein
VYAWLCCSVAIQSLTPGIIRLFLLVSSTSGSCQRKGFAAIPGAPNFRKVEGMNVYGVAIPKVSGVKEGENSGVGAFSLLG